MTYKEEAQQLREALVDLVYMVKMFTDPDEPQDEWIDGVYKTLDQADDVLKRTKS